MKITDRCSKNGMNGVSMALWEKAAEEQDVPRTVSPIPAPRATATRANTQCIVSGREAAQHQINPVATHWALGKFNRKPGPPPEPWPPSSFRKPRLLWASAFLVGKVKQVGATRNGLFSQMLNQAVTVMT